MQTFPIKKRDENFLIKHIRITFFVIFVNIYCTVCPFFLSAQVNNLDTQITYSPFKVVNSSLSIKAENNSLSTITLELQNEVLNEILDKVPSCMQFRLPLTDTSALILNLKREEIIDSSSKVVIGTDLGDEELPINFDSYLGSVIDHNDSWAFVSFSNSGISGVVILGDKTYNLSLSSIKGNFSSGTYILSESLTMNSGQLVQSGDGEYLLPSQSKPYFSPGSLKNFQFLDTLTVKVAIESDYETYVFFGNNSESATAYLLSIFAAVSQIYKREVGIKLQVSYLRVWTTPNDPYSSDIYHWPLMSEFMNYWDANMQDIDRHIALFFSKRFPAGSGSGSGLGMVAGSLCNKSTYSFVNRGWEGDYNIDAGIIYMTAHEIGHNFHSPHTHDCVWPAGPDNSLGPIDSCSSNCTGLIEYSPVGTIMSYCSVDLNMSFHPLTRSLIRVTAENALCIGSGAIGSYTIRGRVTMGAIGLEGAVIKASLNGPTIASTTSDVNGYYSLNLSAEVYDIDCRKENYAIEGPSGPNHAFVVLVKDVNNLNFIAEATPKDSYEPDDVPNLAKQISTQGVIQYRTLHNDFDADYIKFTAQKGECLYIRSYPGENGWSSTLSLLSYKLLDTDFTTQLKFSFINPHIEWVAPITGTYYLLVQGTTGPYGISVTISKPPIANAGPDQIVSAGTTVFLDGSASYDPDGNPLTYKWSSSNGIVLSSSTVPNPNFIAPWVVINADYIFSLVVNGGNVDSPADEVKITVKKSGPVDVIDLKTEDIYVYPNPTDGIVNISLGNISNSKIFISVYDVMGNEVYRKQFEAATIYQIDLSDKSSGMYMIRIFNEKQQVARKLIRR
jgi:hypothetical protein